MTPGRLPNHRRAALLCSPGLDQFQRAGAGRERGARCRGAEGCAAPREARGAAAERQSFGRLSSTHHTELVQ